MNFYEDEFFKASTFLDRWKHLFKLSDFPAPYATFCIRKG